MKLSSKGQIGMIEMIMVIFIVLVLLLIAIFFYYNFFIQSVQETASNLNEQERDILLISILSSPEIQCSLNGVVKPCIDTLKLNTNIINDNRAFYAQYYGFKTIKVKQLYPKPLREADCKELFFRDPSNYPKNCNEWVIFDNKKPNFETKQIVKMPVSLFFPLKNRYHVGELIIEVYQ